MSNYQPFIYLIGWTELNSWYVGCRYRDKCHPNDLWTRYFTSSKLVEQIREWFGEPDVCEVIHTGETAAEVLAYEQQLIETDQLHKHPRWINQGMFKNHLKVGVRTGPLPPDRLERFRKTVEHRKAKNPELFTRIGQHNREKARVHEFRGKMYSVKELADLSGLNVTTIRYRLGKGMSVEDAVTLPDRRNQDNTDPEVRKVATEKAQASRTKEQRSATTKDRWENSEEYRRKHREGMIRRSANPSWRASRRKAARGPDGCFVKNEGDQSPSS